MSYQVKRKAEQLTVPVRGLNYRVYRWGQPDAAPVFLLHGWADTGISFQYLVDALPDTWRLIAPDWRGFGDTDWNRQGYWFPDYLADLDVLIDTFAANKKVRLVGHSMGGNVVLLYAGICPERISHVVTLEQYGLSDSDPDSAPERYAHWLGQWRKPPVNLEYDDINDMEERLRFLGPQLSEERARFLAPYWCKSAEQGKLVSKIDPGHKRVNPVLYRRAEARACWRRITAKVLLGLGADSELTKRYREAGVAQEFKSSFANLTEIVIPRCGHMLHLDQPELTAVALDKFLQEE
ncbi:MAG: AB hydrolase-1 protein [Gammaproteobacteria bacterium]|nr:AB hydrolase-1 protein [Gammaproteobacteria bacterium]